MIGSSQVRRHVDPASQAAIERFLQNGGQITKCETRAHGTCERKKGVQIERRKMTEQDFNFGQSKRDLKADPSVRIDPNARGASFIHD
jgi:hypothetical protein